MKGGEYKKGQRVTVRKTGEEGYVERIERTPIWNISYTEKITELVYYKIYSKSYYYNESRYIGSYKGDELKSSLHPWPQKLSIMKKLSLIAQRLLDKDLGDLVKAGILNEELAVEDTDFVLSFFVTEYKKQLAIEARKLLKRKKKKCEDEEED